MQNNILQVTDQEAESLIKIYNDGGKIYDNEIKGRNGGKIISIEKGVCTIKYENGDIEKCQNPFFRDFKKLKEQSVKNYQS